VDLRGHDTVVPADLPRFYVPPSRLADELRAGRIKGQATLRVKANWRRITGRNLYALVRGARSPLPQGAGAAPPAAMMISVPFEASGLVPDLAVGASQAVQAAAGLALVRELSRQPANRPVVVFFGGADSVQFLATRNMLMALSDVPAVWREALDALAVKERRVAAEVARARQVVGDLSRIEVGRDRGLIDRIVKIVESDAADDQDLLFRERMREHPDPQRVRQLEDRQVLLNRLRFIFQERPAELTSRELAPVAKSYVDRAISRLSDEGTGDGLAQQYARRRRELERRISLYHWLADALSRNPDPGGRTNGSRLIEVLIALDLADGGVRVGPVFYGTFQRASSISTIQDYRDWLTRQERVYDDWRRRGGAGEAPWWARVAGVIDLAPLSGAEAPQSYLGAPLPIGSEMAAAWGVPGFSLVTLDDPRLRRDTPTDVPDHLRVENILPQLRATAELIFTACNDPGFRSQAELKWQRQGWTGQVVSPAPGRPVPDLPREGFLVTYYYVYTVNAKIPPIRELPWTVGIRRTEVHDCDAEGNYSFEGLPRLNDELQTLAVQVYRIEPDTGAIIATSDLGKQAGDLKQYVDIRQEPTPLRSLAFNCAEFALTGLYDPRYLQTLSEVIPLDARRNAEPQRYNMIIFDRLLAGFVEPGSANYLLFRYGRVGNRLVLLNMAEPRPGGAAMLRKELREDARGYTVRQLETIGPLSIATSRDLVRLDEARLDKYAKAGVSSKLLDDLHAEAAGQLREAERAAAENRGTDTVEHANGAWANEARVYQAAQDMANDVVRAAVFLLLLCIPFAFCMERLLIGTPNVYRQIAGAGAIFAVMTAALWSFHPAFRISASPLIIVLAFAIIFMSIVVIGVIYGKFDTELRRLRSGRGSAETTSFARASVLSSAIMLGIASMRRRKFRTALTAVTIVLITFAVLCFTSATQYVGTTTLPAGVASPYPGLMLRQRGFRPMPGVMTENLRVVLRQRQPGTNKPAGPPIVERWWNVNAAEPKDQVHVVAAPAGAEGARPRVFTATAVLGLSPGEGQVSDVGQVVENFERLDKDTAGGERIIYLSTAAANQLGVKKGDHVLAGGISLEVAGLFDPAEFDRRVSALGGEAITPLKYVTGGLDAGGRRLEDTAAESLELGGGGVAGEIAGAYEHLSSSQVVIVPAHVSRLLPNASLRTIAVRLNDYDQVKRDGEELAKRFAVALFAGYEDGVKLVSASSLTSVNGAGQVAVPLAIAGLIVFNTMLGSIAERRREIHVYTSLGLAPLHVGALFVAEAMTYGLIGAVFGYVIGQGVGTALLKLGWLGSVTLNYSGTSAMLTLGLILTVVLLSALVPARIAARIAAPSVETTWKVPLPEGDEIVAELPFTINRTAADGALAYLVEYFDANREGAIGKFSAGLVDAFIPGERTGSAGGDGKARKARGLKTVVWLTPFDLGVRQQLTLLIEPGQFHDIFEVRVILKRLSGDPRSWYRMNRTFLAELRKQFLRWRSLPPERMLEYVEESHRLFTGGRRKGRGARAAAGARTA